MVNITTTGDCGNSPKRLFLEQFNIALAEDNTAFISDSIDDNISWSIIGDKIIEGKSEFLDALSQMYATPTTELVIKRIVMHGKEGAVSGEVVMSDGKKYAYSDFYDFTNAKSTPIKSITSYIIEVT